MLFDILDPLLFIIIFNVIFIFSGVRGTILAGGDCCSRNLFVGACLAARGGVKVSSRNILGGGVSSCQGRNKD